MIVRGHIAVSLVLSGILYGAFQSTGLAVASLASGIFIDLDHLLEYLVTHRMRFRTKEFLSYFYGRRYRKLFLIFHGWEWLAFLAVLSWLTNWNPWAVGSLIGFGQHMLLDQLYNGPCPLGYFFTWRWMNGFERKAFFSDENEGGQEI
jgi:hypothetical protein